jgi:protein-tyrosine phosphatase
MAAVLTAVARAEPGGVLVHCAAGWDRTGLVTLLLLALAGVHPEDIIADYALSAPRMRPVWARLGRPDPERTVAELVAEHGTTVRDSLTETLDWLDPEAYLLAAGVRSEDLAAVRARLVAGPGEEAM